MSMLTQNSSETSVTFSLAELARIEDERVRNEDVQRAKAREQAARERREAEARRRAEEEARIQAQEEARLRRQKAEAEEAARLRAREQAALEVARIQTAAKIQLDAENASRAHELDVLRVKQQSGHKKLQFALFAVIGLAVFGGAGGAALANQNMNRVEAEIDRMKESHAALIRERDQAKTTELQALDLRLMALRARPFGKDGIAATAEVRKTVEDARSAVDSKALDHNRLRAFADALDAFDGRMDALEKLNVLERRFADLSVWAEQRKKSETLDKVRLAAARAKVIADEASLVAFEGALEKLHDELTKAAGGQGSIGVVTSTSGTKCTDPHDPLCGLNGRPL